MVRKSSIATLDIIQIKLQALSETESFGKINNLDNIQIYSTTIKFSHRLAVFYLQSTFNKTDDKVFESNADLWLTHRMELRDIQLPWTLTSKDSDTSPSRFTKKGDRLSSFAESLFNLVSFFGVAEKNEEWLVFSELFRMLEYMKHHARWNEVIFLLVMQCTPWIDHRS